MGHSDLARYNRSGRRLSTLDDKNLYFDLSLAPDGNRLAISRVDQKATQTDIWVFELTEARASWLAYTDSDARHPVWSRVGKKIAYEPAGDIRLMDATGVGKEEVIDTSKRPLATSASKPVCRSRSLMSEPTDCCALAGIGT